jgi:hypothetical protein
MLNPETEALRLVAQSMILDAQNEQRDAEMAMNSHLLMMCNMNQSHVWDKIDFYSRPAHIERCELEGFEDLESETLWIEYEDMIENVNAAVIEDYYEGGQIWTINQ